MGRCHEISRLHRETGLRPEELCERFPKADGQPISPETVKRCLREVRRHPTIVSSDWHLGSTTFLPRSFLSAFEAVRKRVEGKKPTLIIAGDVVGGRWIFTGQEADNITNLPHWQSAAAAALIRRLNNSLGLERVILLKGNHDQDRRNRVDLAMWTAQFARSLGVKVEYAGSEWVGYVGDLLTLVVHGFGSSRYSPHSPSFLVSISQRLLDYSHRQGAVIRRVIHGHTHWTSVNMPWGPVLIDSTGGWQRNERPELGLSQRQPGLILYDPEPSVIVPDTEVLEEELWCDDLPLRNMEFVVSLLKELPEALRA